MNSRDNELVEAPADWAKQVLDQLKKAQADQQPTNQMYFPYILSPDRIEEYKKLQNEISLLIPEESKRPVIILRIVGKERSANEKAEIGLLGGMGPLSDAHIVSTMLKADPKNPTKNDMTNLLLVSAPPPRAEQPEDERKQHKSFRMKWLYYLGENNCKAYAMLSNTAHLHRQGFRFVAGDYAGMINKLTGTTKFINLVREISTHLKEETKDGDKSILVLGTTEAAVGNLYPSELGDKATFQFGKKAPAADKVPKEQVDLQNWVNAAKTSVAEAEKIRDPFLKAMAAWIVDAKPSHVLFACTEIPMFLSYPYAPYGTNYDALIANIKILSQDAVLPKFVDTEEHMIRILNEKRFSLQPSAMEECIEKLNVLIHESGSKSKIVHDDQINFMISLAELLSRRNEMNPDKLHKEIEGLKKQYDKYNVVKTKFLGHKKADSSYVSSVATTFGTVDKSHTGAKINDLVNKIEDIVLKNIIKSSTPM